MPALNKEQIKQYLLQRDAMLHPVISAVTYPVSRRNTDVYNSLLHSIIAQQLSVKAASTIHGRFLGLFPENVPDPDRLARMPVARLRRAGLSERKAAYLKEVAKLARDDGLAYAMLAKKSDTELIEYLTRIHGVGRWTVEMLLMFTFNRKDVFPVDDVGIQNAMRHLYTLDEEGKPFKERLLVIATQWQPYRTIVCKYLWRWKGSGYVTM